MATTEIDFTAAAVPMDAPQSVPAVMDAPANTMLQLIERAARDPRVDIDKMERLIAMQERMQDRDARFAYDNAMATAQQGMNAIRADANNPQTRSKYASYYQLDRAIRPVFTANGFSLSFDTMDGAPEHCIRLVCRVAHTGGHRELHRLDMPADGKGAKGNDVMTKTHATGSAITYGKRYLLGMIFNIAVGGDDDGNAASYRPRNDQPRQSPTYDPPPVDVDGPGSSWGAGGKEAAVDDARRDGLMDNAPRVSPAKRAEMEKWTESALGTLRLSGQTPDTLRTLWQEWNNAKPPAKWAKLALLEEYAPDLFDKVTTAYDAAQEAARAVAA